MALSSLMDLSPLSSASHGNLLRRFFDGDQSVGMDPVVVEARLNDMHMDGTLPDFLAQRNDRGETVHMTALRQLPHLTRITIIRIFHKRQLEHHLDPHSPIPVDNWGRTLLMQSMRAFPLYQKDEVLPADYPHGDVQYRKSLTLSERKRGRSRLHEIVEHLGKFLRDHHDHVDDDDDNGRSQYYHNYVSTCDLHGRNVLHHAYYHFSLRGEHAPKTLSSLIQPLLDIAPWLEWKRDLVSQRTPLFSLLETHQLLKSHIVRAYDSYADVMHTTRYTRPRWSTIEYKPMFEHSCTMCVHGIYQFIRGRCREWARQNVEPTIEHHVDAQGITALLMFVQQLVRVFFWHKRDSDSQRLVAERCAPPAVACDDPADVLNTHKRHWSHPLSVSDCIVTDKRNPGWTTNADILGDRNPSPIALIGKLLVELADAEVFGAGVMAPQSSSAQTSPLHQLARCVMQDKTLIMHTLFPLLEQYPNEFANAMDHTVHIETNDIPYDDPVVPTHETVWHTLIRELCLRTRANPVMNLRRLRTLLEKVPYSCWDTSWVHIHPEQHNRGTRETTTTTTTTGLLLWYTTSPRARMTFTRCVYHDWCHSKRYAEERYELLQKEILRFLYSYILPYATHLFVDLKASSFIVSSLFSLVRSTRFLFDSEKLFYTLYLRGAQWDDLRRADVSLDNLPLSVAYGMSSSGFPDNYTDWYDCKQCIICMEGHASVGVFPSRQVVYCDECAMYVYRSIPNRIKIWIRRLLQRTQSVQARDEFVGQIDDSDDDDDDDDDDHNTPSAPNSIVDPLVCPQTRSSVITFVNVASKTPHVHVQPFDYVPLELYDTLDLNAHIHRRDKVRQYPDTDALQPERKRTHVVDDDGSDDDDAEQPGKRQRTDNDTEGQTHSAGISS